MDLEAVAESEKKREKGRTVSH